MLIAEFSFFLLFSISPFCSGVRGWVDGLVGVMKGAQGRAIRGAVYTLFVSFRIRI